MIYLNVIAHNSHNMAYKIDYERIEMSLKEWQYADIEGNYYKYSGLTLWNNKSGYKLALRMTGPLNFSTKYHPTLREAFYELDYKMINYMHELNASLYKPTYFDTAWDDPVTGKPGR